MYCLQKTLLTLLLLSTLYLPSHCCAQALEGESPNLDIAEEFNMQRGPIQANMQNLCQINVPEGYVFGDKQITEQLMESMQNPVDGTEIGLLAPANMDWFVVFEFDDTGYIKDDEKDSLDADAMLASIREGTRIGNQERLSRGWPTMEIVGWEQTPHYDAQSHNLAWAIRGRSEDHDVVNYNTRILGRSGVTKATLVADPAILASVMPDFNSLLATFDYTAGNKYAEYHEGDKIAEYGLSALVVGGATAVAAKSGLFKYLGKGIYIGAIAVLGVAGKIIQTLKDKFSRS